MNIIYFSTSQSNRTRDTAEHSNNKIHMNGDVVTSIEPKALSSTPTKYPGISKRVFSSDYIQEGLIS